MNRSRKSLKAPARILALTLGLLAATATASYAQYGYGGYGYGGFGGGYGGGGYGGFGGGGYGGFGGGGYGGFGGGYGYGLVQPGYIGLDMTGLGYPGIGYRNPYFGAGLSPLAVETALFERQVLGRTTVYRFVPASTSAPRPAPRPTERVGMGAFGGP